jgi:hypothetical protein
MSDIPDLIKKLQSNNSNERYDACEQLRVTQSLTQEAIEALRSAANDKNADVADAARRALGLHAPEPARDVADRHNQNTSSTPTANLIGTFGAGWVSGFIIAICPALTPIYFSQESAALLLFIFGLLLFLFGLLISFFMKARSLKVWPLVFSGLGLGLCSPLIGLVLYAGMGGSLY